jgi:hypothetical protein
MTTDGSKLRFTYNFKIFKISRLIATIVQTCKTGSFDLQNVTIKRHQRLMRA